MAGIDSAPETGRALRLVEYTDAHDRPLLLGPPEEAGRIGLVRRVVAVALLDARRRIYLQRRAADLALFPGLWGFSAAGFVLAGEAREEAAARLLTEETGVRDAPLTPLAVLTPDKGHSRYHLTLFRAGPGTFAPRPAPGRADESLFVDRHELRGLAEHASELLTPELLWAVVSGQLFTRAAPR